MNLQNLLSTVPVTLTIVMVLGFVGAHVFNKLCIPAPNLTGALIFNALFLQTGLRLASIPVWVVVIIQVLIGIMIGSRLDQGDKQHIRSLLVPGLLVSVWMIFVGLGLGIMIMKLTDFDVGTSLLSAVPGGMSEMAVLAMSYNLNVPMVALFQLLRVTIIYITVPLMAQFISKRNISRERNGKIQRSETKEKGKKEYSEIFTLVIGMFMGFLGWYFHVPSGAIILPFVTIGGMRLFGVRLKGISSKYVLVAQVGLGATLGLSFTPEVVKSLHNILWIALLFGIIVVVNGFVLGYITHKLFHWDLITALLACASAGLSQMSTIAMEMGGDVITVGVIQTIRLAAIVLVLPPIIISIIT